MELFTHGILFHNLNLSHVSSTARARTGEGPGYSALRSPRFAFDHEGHVVQLTLPLVMYVGLNGQPPVQARSTAVKCQDIAFSHDLFKFYVLSTSCFCFPSNRVPKIISAGVWEGWWRQWTHWLYYCCFQHSCVNVQHWTCRSFQNQTYCWQHCPCNRYNYSSCFWLCQCLVSYLDANYSCTTWMQHKWQCWLKHCVFLSPLSLFVASQRVWQ